MSSLQPSSWLIPKAPPSSGFPGQAPTPSLGRHPGAPPGPRPSFGGGGGSGTSFLVPSGGTPSAPAATTHPEYFSGINMERLQTEFPDLYAKISKFMAGKGKLGPTYQYLIGNLGRAVTADDTFSENDIRSAALSARNPVQAQAFQDRKRTMDSAAIGGALDSGDTYKYLALQDADADLRAEQAAEGTVSDLTGYNQEARYRSMRSALDDLNAWAQNRRALRMSDAGAGALVAQMEGAVEAQRAASQWGAASALLGAGSRLAGQKGW